MRIAEIYSSLQGEGLLTGTPSVFIRASGCNLRCWFCDTPFTSWQPEGEDLSVDEIMRRVDGSNVAWASAHANGDEPFVSRGLKPMLQSNSGVHHAVLTGGEPMLFAEAIPLTQRLRESGFHITIETAGTLNLPVECDLMSISPKLSNSTPAAERDERWRRRHEQTRHSPEVIHRLIIEYPYQMKFVIDAPSDCDEVETYLAEFPEINRSRVLLMPQGTSVAELEARREWLEPLCRRQGFIYCPRRHIEWYGHVRGT
jgi:7-carboxy-7-deazaguanine synthase